MDRSEMAKVETLIREVATAEVLARFRSLKAGEVDEKGPGDLVTIADRECERILGHRLAEIRDIPILGEEAVSADPTSLAATASSPACWTVDPVDGTANFVSGSKDFAVMVAYVEAGVSKAAWIWHPVDDIMYTARAGMGAWRNDQPLAVSPADDPSAGIVKTRWIPEPVRTGVQTAIADWSLTADRGCAGVEYSLLAEGRLGFLIYHRTMPWDHAPGTLVATEAGLRAGRLDGSPYRIDDDRQGLLTARHDHFEAQAKPLHAALQTPSAGSD